MTAPTRDLPPVSYVIAHAGTEVQRLMPLPPGFEVAAVDAPLSVELVVQDAHGNQRRIWPPGTLEVDEADQ